MMTQQAETNSRTRRTIEDFGEQWSWHTDNSGYYGSSELLRDILEPLLRVEAIEGMRVAEIGCGTGRIADMMLRAGAREVTGVEPSAAAAVAARNLSSWGDRFRLVVAPGTETPRAGFDLVVSIGVLHHIPEPEPVAKAMHGALRPGGRALIWVYGREGNGAYLALAGALRSVTTRLPHAALVGACWMVWVGAMMYGMAAALIPGLPLRRYFRQYFLRLAPAKQHLVIYDQLNPAHAVYYRRADAERLLRDAGFQDVRSHHRHGYSWTVIGTRA
jgi:SAM-dependent methyltransferase